MRLIDADALMNEFDRTLLGNNPRGVIRATIEDAPSVEPEQRWIPCSERLPKAFEYCLWTTTDGKVVYHYCDGQFSKYIAWMPLPEPYKDGE